MTLDPLRHFRGQRLRQRLRDYGDSVNYGDSYQMHSILPCPLRGGGVVAAGTPEQVAKKARSFTGRYLHPMLSRANAPA